MDTSTASNPPPPVIPRGVYKRGMDPRNIFSGCPSKRFRMETASDVERAFQEIRTASASETEDERIAKRIDKVYECAFCDSEDDIEEENLTTGGIEPPMVTQVSNPASDLLEGLNDSREIAMASAYARRQKKGVKVPPIKGPLHPLTGKKKKKKKKKLEKNFLFGKNHKSCC